MADVTYIIPGADPENVIAALDGRWAASSQAPAVRDGETRATYTLDLPPLRETIVVSPSDGGTTLALTVTCPGQDEEALARVMATGIHDQLADFGAATRRERPDAPGPLALEYGTDSIDVLVAAPPTRVAPAIAYWAQRSARADSAVVYRQPDGEIQWQFIGEGLDAATVGFRVDALGKGSRVRVAFSDQDKLRPAWDAIWGPGGGREPFETAITRLASARSHPPARSIE